MEDDSTPDEYRQIDSQVGDILINDEGIVIREYT
jgi:hypothetical protein